MITWVSYAGRVCGVCLSRGVKWSREKYFIVGVFRQLNAHLGRSYKQINYDLYKLCKNNAFQIMYIIKKIPSSEIK